VKTLIATVGLPRSGKTTWARQQGVPIVCPDSIRLALHGERYIALAEPFVWATAKVMVRALFLAGHSAVILDATNITRKRRDEWQSTEWNTQFQAIPTDRDVCVARATYEDDQYIIPIIHQMADAFEPLQQGEALFIREWGQR
jgi:predicted kinase